MAQSGGITTKDQKAKETVNTAIKALGGADKIGGIKSLVIKGKITVEYGELPFGIQPEIMGYPKSGTTYEIEIRILLPDSFLTIASPPGRPISYAGISRGKMLSPSSVTGIDGKPREFPNPTQARMAENDSFARNAAEWSYFLIGTLMKAGPEPLTLSSRVTPNLFNMNTTNSDVPGEIEFDSDGYPSIVKGGHIAEMRLNDRFPVNGIMFPRIITKNYGLTKTEMRIEEVLINPKLSLKDFEVPK